MKKVGGLFGEARRAESERAPKGHASGARRSPEAEDSAGGTPAAGENFGKNRIFNPFSKHSRPKTIKLQSQEITQSQIIEDE